MTQTSTTAGALALIVAFSVGTSADQRGRSTVPLVIDRSPGPASLDALVNSDLVAVVTLLNATYHNEGRTPRTHFEAKIVEIVRDSGKRPVGNVIEVYRYGGRVQTPRGPADEDELNFSRWSPGMTLLLSMAWNNAIGAYNPGGPDYAYQLEPMSGRVKAFGHGELAHSWHGHPVTEFLAEVKKSAAKRR